MIPFFAVLTKQAFTSLHRFGEIHLKTIPVIARGRKDPFFQNELSELFTRLPYFAGDEEYIFACFETLTTHPVVLHAQDVTELIPMTTMAKASLETKFDPIVPFSQPEYETVVEQVLKYIDIEDRVRGVEVLQRLLPGSGNNLDIINKRELDRVIDIRSGRKVLSGEDSINVHLLSYDRYENYLNDDVGYIYDAAEVFAKLNGLSSLEGTAFHTFLEENRGSLREKKLSAIFTFLDSAPEADKYQAGMMDKRTGMRYDIVAALFFRFRNILDSDSDLDSTPIPTIVAYNLEEGEGRYPSEIKAVVELIGAFFGFNRFYTGYYKRLRPESSSCTKEQSNRSMEWEVPATSNKHREGPKNKTVAAPTAESFSLFDGATEPVSGKGNDVDPVVKIHSQIQHMLESGEIEVKREVLDDLKQKLKGRIKKQTKEGIGEWLSENASEYCLVTRAGSKLYLSPAQRSD